MAAEVLYVAEVAASCASAGMPLRGFAARTTAALCRIFLPRSTAHLLQIAAHEFLLGGF
jgi:hypothetical protein